jgi:hypothetical protein
MTQLLSPYQLVQYARNCLGLPYWYGTYGQVATPALLAAKAMQYPGMYTPIRIAKCRTEMGKRVYDCVGLIKGCYWDAFYGGKRQPESDLSADGMFARCTEKGPISTLPEIPGLVLHLPGHIAVYEGNGYLIEEINFAKGCIRSTVAGRSFTEWGKCHLVEYKKEDDVMLKYGDHDPIDPITGETIPGPVWAWQSSLNADGIEMIGNDGKVYPPDGSFGKATVNGTNVFKQRVGLPQDGYVDNATQGKMTFDLLALITGYTEQITALNGDIEALKRQVIAAQAEIVRMQGALVKVTADRDRIMAVVLEYQNASSRLMSL